MVDELSRFPSGNPSKRPISGMGAFGVFVRTIYFQDNVFRACLHKKHTVGHFSTFAGTSFCEGRGEVHVEGHEGMMHQDKDAFDAKSLDFSHDGSANADDFVTDKGRPADEMCLSIMAKADEYMALGESMILWRTSCIVIVMYR